MDRYLTKHLSHRSRSSLRSLILEGALEVTKVRPGHTIPGKLKPSTPVQAGMGLLIRQSARPRLPTEHLEPRSPIGVLWEDANLLAINKSAGMLVHPSGTLYHETLIVILKNLVQGPERLHLGHRLDRETSGVIIIARGDEPNRRIKAAFKARQIKKGYLAIVHGTPQWNTAESNAPLTQGPPEQLVRLRQVECPTGSPSLTHFDVIARGTHHSLVACRPHTGRLHQIRVHLEGLGYPILGDKIYGSDGSPFIQFLDYGPSEELDEQLGHWRQALHAHWIELDHPETGERITFSAPLAPDLCSLWAKLCPDRPITLNWPAPPAATLTTLSESA